MTSDGNATYGVNETGDVQIFGSYSTASNAFFGFVGREELNGDDMVLTALGLIAYDYKCVKDEQTRLGEEF